MCRKKEGRKKEKGERNGSWFQRRELTVAATAPIAYNFILMIHYCDTPFLRVMGKVTTCVHVACGTCYLCCMYESLRALLPPQLDLGILFQTLFPMLLVPFRCVFVREVSFHFSCYNSSVVLIVLFMCMFHFSVCLSSVVHSFVDLHSLG